MIRHLSLFLAIFVFPQLVLAQSNPPRQPEPLDVLADRPDAPQQHALLGQTFESMAAGLSFRAPAGWKQIRRAGTDEIVQYVNDEKKWSLRASRVALSQPVPLSASIVEGPATQGLLELTIEKKRQELTGMELLRQEVINIGQANAGVMVLRYGLGEARTLVHTAMIQADPQLYYVISLTSPAGQSVVDDPNTPNDESHEDPQDLRASELFRAVTDSVTLLDRSALKEEQDQRLYRTRALFVNLSEDKLRRALVPHQYLRLLRDGKDIGYTYVVEELAQALTEKTEPAKQGSPNGFRIGVRSRTMPDANMQVDAESWQFVTFDRRNEAWSSVAYIQAKPTKPDEAPKSQTVMEFGLSERRVTRVLDESLRQGTQGDPNQPPVRPTETYDLTVTRASQNVKAEPIRRELPPFYVPQALAHLLPRLLPLNEPKTYLFAIYVGERQEVMLRYLDVQREKRVTLDGKEVLAIPVKDRVGAEGPVTLHYLTARGEYLGSVSEDTGITILPSDADSLRKIWPNPELTRPGEIEALK